MANLILDIVDCQRSFMREGHDLPVPGAQEIIPQINAFFSQLSEDLFNLALIKLDTHFSGEYPYSPESQAFENIHCEYREDGWQLAVWLYNLPARIPKHYMAKNAFDMWGTNPTGVPKDTIQFKNKAEEEVYDNLFHVTRDVSCRESGIARDDFMDKHDIGKNTEVVMLGVASNFCVDDAIRGYLARGCKVTVIADLTRGIPLPKEAVEDFARRGEERAGSGTIEEVFRLRKYEGYVNSRQLRLVSAREFLEKHGLKKAAPRVGEGLPPGALTEKNGGKSCNDR